MSTNFSNLLNDKKVGAIFSFMDMAASVVQDGFSKMEEKIPGTPSEPKSKMVSVKELNMSSVLILPAGEKQVSSFHVDGNDLNYAYVDLMGGDSLYMPLNAQVQVR